MKGIKLAKNTISSLIYQISAVICGFVLPRLIISNYGSDVNGLVNSIIQFLQVITFLELGVGAVVQSSLYKPLAEKDNNLTSKIIVSASSFFKRIAEILLLYVVVLLFFYPLIHIEEFDYLYTATLIAAMSISSFAQYYFGVVDRLLLTADQRGYIQYNAQTITILLNTVACVVLIDFGASIHIVKLVTSIIYLVRPLFLRMYVDRNYCLDRKITYDEEPIKQKWNGIAQHVAAVILDGTDNIVLTLFSEISNVSIYSVYNMVVFGIKQLFLSLTNGIQALIGELWAKQELKKLNDLFGWVEWFVHTGVVFVFTCTGVLILPFVSVYTLGVHDAEYIQPLFAILITCANAMHCLRLPYNIMILAGGHYKQTQKNYIVAAVMNITFSIVAVHILGLIGVAIGTLCAMAYQTVWMAVYDSKNLIRWPLIKSVKQLFTDIVGVSLSIIITMPIKMSHLSYFAWMVMAVKVACLVGIAVLFVNVLFYRDMLIRLWNKIIRIRDRSRL